MKILGEIDEVLNEGRLAELDAVISEVFSGGNGCRCEDKEEDLWQSGGHRTCVPTRCGCSSLLPRMELTAFGSWSSHPARYALDYAAIGYSLPPNGNNELINRFIVACSEALSRGETPPRWDAWLYLEEEGTEGLQP